LKGAVHKCSLDLFSIVVKRYDLQYLQASAR
jgi:hypothetical protein